MAEFIPHVKFLLRDPERFVEYASQLTLRAYQKGVLAAIFDSVINMHGYTFVVLFPRQSGKNELQAQLEVYLLTLFSNFTVEMIKVSPTLEPQALTAMRRFEKVACQNTLLHKVWQKQSGNGYKVGDARITFLSGARESNIVGATASALLEVDEAQEVLTFKYDRDVAPPMSASTHATRVFWGTAWTSKTLLSREMRFAKEAETKDGVRRVFRLTAEDVAKEVAGYDESTKEIIARLGRAHPLVRTQYFSEEVDEEGGMFPPDRLERMRGDQSPEREPIPGRHYALLLDVAGADEGKRGIEGSITMTNPARDASALTLVSVGFRSSDLELSTPVDKVIHSGVEVTLPVYSPVRRWQWVGMRHDQLHNIIREIALHWRVRTLVIDATGVGAGLAAFLERSLPGRVTPFTFNSSSKSRLGWDFMGVVDSGRWREPLLSENSPGEQKRYQEQFFVQLSACQFLIQDGPEQRIRWQVPNDCRDPQTGELLHDDWVLSAALVGVLESADWHAPGETIIIPAPDPLKEMDKGF